METTKNTTHIGVNMEVVGIKKSHPEVSASFIMHEIRVTSDDIEKAQERSSSRKLKESLEENRMCCDKAKVLFSASNVNLSQDYINACFGMACRTYISNKDIPSLLLKYGPDINHELLDSGMTALHEAVQKDCMDTVSFLINVGAKVNITSSELSRQGKVWSPVLPICCATNKTMASFLLSAGSDIRSCLSHPPDKDHLTEHVKQTLKELFTSVQSLHHCSRMAIRKHISDCHFKDKVYSLPLPRRLQDYILFSDIKF